jgi:hypothetical protein
VRGLKKKKRKRKTKEQRKGKKWSQLVWDRPVGKGDIIIQNFGLSTYFRPMELLVNDK